MKIQLLPPLKKRKVTQPFGVNYVNFYKSLGLLGHNGIDFRASIGTSLYAAHSGVVIIARTDSQGGKIIEIITSKTGEGYKTIYYHLNDIIVKVGDKIIAGQLIGQTGNTGKYTSGPHLHFGLKLTKNSVTQNKNNGYRGAIDPEPYFPKKYDKSRAYHRYGRKRNWTAEYCMRFAPINIKNRWTNAGRYIHKLSKRLYFSIPISGEMINALVYGGWDIDSVINPAMNQSWRWYKKSEFLEKYSNLK